MRAILLAGATAASFFGVRVSRLRSQSLPSRKAGGEVPPGLACWRRDLRGHRLRDLGQGRPSLEPYLGDARC